MEPIMEATQTLAARLAERVRQDHGEGANIERLVLVASITQADGRQRAVVEGNGLEPYEQAGTLRHGLSAITAPR